MNKGIKIIITSAAVFSLLQFAPMAAFANDDWWEENWKELGHIIGALQSIYKSLQEQLSELDRFPLKNAWETLESAKEVADSKDDERTKLDQERGFLEDALKALVIARNETAPEGEKSYQKEMREERLRRIKAILAATAKVPGLLDEFHAVIKRIEAKIAAIDKRKNEGGGKTGAAVVAPAGTGAAPKELPPPDINKQWEDNKAMLARIKALFESVRARVNPKDTVRMPAANRAGQNIDAAIAAAEKRDAAAEKAALTDAQKNLRGVAGNDKDLQNDVAELLKLITAKLETSLLRYASVPSVRNGKAVAAKDAAAPMMQLSVALPNIPTKAVTQFTLSGVPRALAAQLQKGYRAKFTLKSKRAFTLSFMRVQCQPASAAPRAEGIPELVGEAVVTCNGLATIPSATQNNLKNNIAGVHIIVGGNTYPVTFTANEQMNVRGSRIPAKPRQKASEPKTPASTPASSNGVPTTGGGYIDIRAVCQANPSQYGKVCANGILTECTSGEFRTFGDHALTVNGECLFCAAGATGAVTLNPGACQ